MVKRFSILSTILALSNALPSPDQTVPDFQNSIYYGKSFDPTKYPSLVSISMQNAVVARQHMCGGTLIEPNMVLTAAHCTDSASPALLQVRINAHNLNERGDTEEIIPVKYFHIHPAWDRKTNYATTDIAILELAYPSKHGTLAKLDLTGTAAKVPGNKYIVTGWGKTDRGMAVVPTDVKLILRSDKRCKTDMPRFRNIEMSHLICAGYSDNPSKDSCSGDSGGPMFSTVNQEIVQIGLVSFGSEFCGTGQYSLHSALSMFNDFIHSVSAETVTRHFINAYRPVKRVVANQVPAKGQECACFAGKAGLYGEKCNMNPTPIFPKDTRWCFVSAACKSAQQNPETGLYIVDCGKGTSLARRLDESESPTNATLPPPDITAATQPSNAVGLGELDTNLLFLNFDGQFLRKHWSVIDAGNMDGPSDWHFDSRTESLLQDSNIYSMQKRGTLNKRGTKIEYQLGYEWTSYSFVLHLASTDNDVIGVNFCYQNDGSFYQLTFDRQSTKENTKLVKCVDSECTILGSTTDRYEVGHWFKVGLQQKDGRIMVVINDRTYPTFDLVDPSPLTHGTIGLYCWANRNCYFDDIVVDSRFFDTEMFLDFTYQLDPKFSRPINRFFETAKSLNVEELSQEEFDTVATADRIQELDSKTYFGLFTKNQAKTAAVIGLGGIIAIPLAILSIAAICCCCIRRQQNKDLFDNLEARYDTPAYNDIGVMLNNGALKKCLIAGCDCMRAEKGTDYYELECKCGHGLTLHEGYIEWMTHVEELTNQKGRSMLKRDKANVELEEEVSTPQMTDGQRLMNSRLLNQRLMQENKALREDMHDIDMKSSRRSLFVYGHRHSKQTPAPALPRSCSFNLHGSIKPPTKEKNKFRFRSAAADYFVADGRVERGRLLDKPDDKTAPTSQI